MNINAMLRYWGDCIERGEEESERPLEIVAMVITIGMCAIPILVLTTPFFLIGFVAKALEVK